MFRNFGPVIVLLGIVCCSPAFGNDLLHGLLGACVPDCIGKWCCDDYCPKKQPHICVSIDSCCDDYCSKKEPCVCAPLDFCCDDYLRKCLPRVCSPPMCGSLKCSSASGCVHCPTNNDQPCASDTKTVAAKDVVTVRRDLVKYLGLHRASSRKQIQ